MSEHLPPLVSIVILNYNGKKFLKGCLASVAKSNYENYEIILVDNASTDGSCQLNPQDFNFSKFTLLENPENLGFAAGNNVGALKAQGKYVIFLNSDTEVNQDWLKELVLVMEADVNIGAAQSNLLRFDRKTVDSAGDFIDHYGIGLSKQHGEVIEKQCLVNEEIFSARGAAIMIRKLVLDRVGCFDSSFFMLCEDVDLSWRIRLNGFKIVLVPKSIVYHFGSGTRESYESSARNYYYNTRNGLMMLIKNYELKNLVRYGSAKVLFQVLLFLFAFPFGSKRRYNLSRITAITSVILDFKAVWIKRIWVQTEVRKVSDSEIKKPMIKQNLSMLQIIWIFLYRGKIGYNDFINRMAAA